MHGQSLESKFIVVGNHNLNLCSAAELNGKFVKANESSNQETQATTSLENDRAISAFNVMMSASRRLPILPPPPPVYLYETVRTGYTMQYAHLLKPARYFGMVVKSAMELLLDVWGH